MKTRALIFFVLGFGAGFLVFILFFSRPQTQPEQNQSPKEDDTLNYAPDIWKTWQDGMYTKTGGDYWGYAVEYPRDFEVTAGNSASSASFLNSHPVKISFPEDSFQDQKTNFAGAWMGFSYKPVSVMENCFALFLPASSIETPEENTIAGIDFKIFKVAAAAAGNIHHYRIYRAVVNGICFEAAQTIHTGNIGNYTSGAVSEFDALLAENIFDRIIQTLSFTNKSPY